MSRLKTLGHIPWSAPEGYLGIDWHEKGPYNSLAEPHNPITQDEFLSRVHASPYGLRGINFGQVYLSAEKRNGMPMWNVRYYMFHNACYAVATSYRSKGRNGLPKVEYPTYAVDQDKWGYHLMRYFKVGCSHPNAYEVTHRMFDHERICPDCGWRHRYDSSG